MNMTRTASIALAALAVLLACSPGAHAAQAQLVRVEATPMHVEVGQPITLTVTVGKAGDSVWCGAVATFGDGSSRELRIDNPTYTFTQTYTKPGTYAVSLVGTFVRRGLRSTFACDGSISSDPVVVDEAGRGAAAQSAAQRASQAEYDRLKHELDRVRNERPAPASSPGAADPGAQAKPAPAPPAAPRPPRKPRPPASTASDSRPI